MRSICHQLLDDLRRAPREERLPRTLAYALLVVICGMAWTTVIGAIGLLVKVLALWRIA